MEKLQKGVNYTFSVLLGIFFVFVSICSVINLSNSPHGSFSILWIGLYLLAFVGIFVLAYLTNKKRKLWIDLLIVFAAALILRLMAACKFTYTPENDFKNYIEAGLMFRDQTAENLPILQNFLAFYGQEYIGIAIGNAFLAMLFSPTVLGFQIGYSIITSLSVVFIYLIGATVNRNIGFVAALLYAIYPSGIIGTQLTTNQHFATLFCLISIYFLGLAIKNIGKQNKKAILQGIGSGLFLMAGHLNHPITPVIVIAIVVFIILNIIFGKKGWRAKLWTGMLLVVLLGCWYGGQLGFYAVERAAGWYPEWGNSLTVNYKMKIALGLNQETMGMYSAEDWTEMLSAKDNAARDAMIDQWLVERTADKEKMLKMLAKKTAIMWAGPDTMYDWLTAPGYSALIQKSTQGEALTDGESSIVAEYYDNLYSFQRLDMLFCLILYAASAVGVFYKKGKDQSSVFYLLIWCVLGWVAAHILIEMQPRYRYFAMPLVCIFAAAGMFLIRGWIICLKQRISVKRVSLESRKSGS